MADEPEPFCFWCGGNARVFFECPPRPIRMDMAYCKMCASLAETGIAVHETTEIYPGYDARPVSSSLWFTGRWTVVRPVDLELIYEPWKISEIKKAGAATLHASYYHSHHLDHYPWRTIQ